MLFLGTLGIDISDMILLRNANGLFSYAFLAAIPGNICTPSRIRNIQVLIVHRPPPVEVPHKELANFGA